MRKTANQILEECANHSFKFVTNAEAIRAMKLYANAKLDEAAKLPMLEFQYINPFEGDQPYVNTDKILSLKDSIV